MASTILSILMLAGFALTAGGLHLLLRRGDKRRGALMLLAALVMFANVAIWLVPVADGASLNAGAASPALLDR